MAKELTDKERSEIRRKKEKTLEKYQHKLNIFRQKILQWDSDVMNKKSENGQRMWVEGKNQMSYKEVRVQAEIDRLRSISEEEWEHRRDEFDVVMDKFMSTYNSAVAKIRYDHPGDTYLTRTFKQKIP